MKKILSVILALALMMTAVLAVADTSYTATGDSQIGGVGAVTTAILASHVIEAARRS